MFPGCSVFNFWLNYQYQPTNGASVRFDAAWLNLKYTSNRLKCKTTSSTASNQNWLLNSQNSLMSYHIIIQNQNRLLMGDSHIMNQRNLVLWKLMSWTFICVTPFGDHKTATRRIQFTAYEDNRITYLPSFRETFLYVLNWDLNVTIREMNKAFCPSLHVSLGFIIRLAVTATEHFSVPV